MTSLNPSHNPFSTRQRAGQAFYRPSNDPLGVDDSDDEVANYLTKAEKEGRRRVKRAAPPIPDLRFEQSYLLSIRPFLHPKPDASRPASTASTSGAAQPLEPESTSLVTSADKDDVFHWGRDVDVEWGVVAWVTARDQFLSPLAQGFLWGIFGIFSSMATTSLRAALYPPRHVPKGRIVGGSGGAVGGGEVVGDPSKGGWWRKWVKSWGGAFENVMV